MAKAKRALGGLTIIQPWAEVILRHGKNVENRQKNSHYRGGVVLHASQLRSTGWFQDCPLKFDADDLTFGAVIGVANLVDVIKKKQVTSKTRKWFGGEFGLVLEDVMPLKKPVPMKGKRGVWQLSSKQVEACLKQLSPSQRKRLKNFEKLK